MELAVEKLRIPRESSKLQNFYQQIFFKPKYQKEEKNLLASFPTGNGGKFIEKGILEVLRF